MQASLAELNAHEADLITAKDKRRLEVMSRYFEVVIADMQYTAGLEPVKIKDEAAYQVDVAFPSKEQLRAGIAAMVTLP